MAGKFAGQAVLESPATPAVIHIHKLDRPENTVSPGRGRGEGAMAGDVAPSPHPLPRSDPSLSIQPIAGERGQKMAAADFSNAHTQTYRES